MLCGRGAFWGGENFISALLEGAVLGWYGEGLWHIMYFFLLYMQMREFDCLGIVLLIVRVWFL